MSNCLLLVSCCLIDLCVYTNVFSVVEVEPSEMVPRSSLGSSSLFSSLAGTLRNMSSAGESARSFMRSTNGMVDTLLWLLKAGVQQRSAADEKVRGLKVEGTMIGELLFPVYLKLKCDFGGLA